MVSFIITPVSDMCNVLSYFPHFLHLSLAFNEVNITEWGLMTVRMHRKRVNVFNNSIICGLYIKIGAAYM